MYPTILKKRKGKEREKTFYSSKMSRRRSKLVTIHHPFDGFSKHLLPLAKYGKRYRELSRVSLFQRFDKKYSPR